jgi:hypothetical protein
MMRKLKISLELLKAIAMGERPLIISEFNTPIYTKEPKTVPSESELENPDFNCPFETESEGKVWTVLTKHRVTQDTFDGREVDVNSIVTWITGNDDQTGQYFSIVVEPKEILLNMSEIVLTFWENDVLLDYPPETNKIHVFGKLNDGRTFLANGPAPGFRQRP